MLFPSYALDLNISQIPMAPITKLHNQTPIKGDRVPAFAKAFPVANKI